MQQVFSVSFDLFYLCIVMFERVQSFWRGDWYLNVEQVGVSCS